MNCISASLPSSPFSSLPKQRSRNRLVCKGGGQLVLYSKPECPLCTRLESQIQSLIDRSQFVPSSLSNLSFKVIDVTLSTTNQYLTAEVPVLSKISSTGEEEKLPRFSPRLTTERLGKKLEAIFTES